MYCTRKHLLFDKSYVIYLNSDNISIGESTKKIKYVIPFGLETIIDWKVNEEEQHQIEAFCLQWGREWKYFYAEPNVCLKVKQHLNGRVTYKNMDIFYNPLERIESKTFSLVRTVQATEGDQVFVCKETNKTKKHAVLLFQNEVEILNELKHKNIVKLIEAFENTHNYQIILEFLKGGSLKQCLKYCKLNINESLIIIKQLLEALQYLHKNGYVHRDLKPDNILFCNLGQFSHLKIIDFGISTKITLLEKDHDMKYGTPGYIAPEILNCSKKKAISEKIDIFSCGAILYQLLTGKQMISGTTQKEIMERNKLFNFTSDFGLDIQSLQYRELVARMVAKDPQTRPSASEALAFLQYLHLPPLQLSCSLSVSLQCQQDPVQELPDFKKLITKA